MMPLLPEAGMEWFPGGPMLHELLDSWLHLWPLGSSLPQSGAASSTDSVPHSGLRAARWPGVDTAADPNCGWEPVPLSPGG